MTIDQAPGPLLTSRFGDALEWANKLHADQVRKGTAVPYVSHLLAVASLVMEHGGTEDQAIAGLLHDSIEDQGVTGEEIEKRFGPGVSAIVLACTDAHTIPKPPWRQRKRAYIAHLADAPAEALLVSLADKTHNARCVAADVERVGEAYLDIFTAGPSGTRWYYRRLLDAFEARVQDLPPETAAEGHAAPGGRSFLKELGRAIDRFRADEATAQVYEDAQR